MTLLKNKKLFRKGETLKKQSHLSSQFFNFEFSKIHFYEIVLKKSFEI